MTHPTDKAREAFEAWWGQPPMDVAPFEKRTHPEELTMWAWQAFQAATKLARTAALNDAIEICHEVLAPTKQSSAEVPTAFRDAYISGVNRCINRLELRNGK